MTRIFPSITPRWYDEDDDEEEKDPEDDDAKARN